MAEHCGYDQERLQDYTCYRAQSPMTIDGRLDEASWALAPRSPRFEDLETPGRPATDAGRTAADSGAMAIVREELSHV
jgi:hypothetical protein